MFDVVRMASCSFVEYKNSGNTFQARPKICICPQPLPPTPAHPRPIKQDRLKTR